MLKCKDCCYQFSQRDRRKGKPMKTKLLAYWLYLEGLGLQGIGRVVKVSKVTMLRWIRELSDQFDERLSIDKKEVEVIEIDEMGALFR